VNRQCILVVFVVENLTLHCVPIVWSTALISVISQLTSASQSRNRTAGSDSRVVVSELNTEHEQKLVTVTSTVTMALLSGKTNVVTIHYCYLDNAVSLCFVMGSNIPVNRLQRHLSMHVIS